LNCRRYTVFYEGVSEFAALLCDISIPKVVRDREALSSLLESYGNICSFENEILSLKRETTKGEQFNLVIIKCNQGIPTERAFQVTLRLIWDNTFQFVRSANLLIEELLMDTQLCDYIDLTVDLINGNTAMHSIMERYDSKSCVSQYKDVCKVSGIETLLPLVHEGLNFFRKN